MTNKKAVNVYSSRETAPMGDCGVKKVAAESISATLQAKAILRSVEAPRCALPAKDEMQRAVEVLQKTQQQGKTVKLIAGVSAAAAASSAVFSAVSPLVGVAALSTESLAAGKLVVPATAKLVKAVQGESRKNKLKRLKQQKLELERKKGHCL